jgi:hypothetical protein
MGFAAMTSMVCEVPDKTADLSAHYAWLALRIASLRPLYARAYIQALEVAGRVPLGAFYLHEGEMVRVSPERDAREIARGRRHANTGVRPTFIDTNIQGGTS